MVKVYFLCVFLKSLKKMVSMLFCYKALVSPAIFEILDNFWSDCYGDFCVSLCSFYLLYGCCCHDLTDSVGVVLA